MDIVVGREALRDPARVGNKACNLAILRDAGFDVPPFFVIAAEALNAHHSPAELAAEIARAAGEELAADLNVAVRSSSVEEDGGRASFAGQFDSFLDIDRDRILHYARRVAGSAHSKHIDCYRESRGLAGRDIAPAILVQQMVDADAAGVAFAADPVTGETAEAVIAATAGTGEALVGGAVQGDTWRVDQKGDIVDRAPEGPRAVLSDHEVREVALLARAVSRHQGRPQDIEWAIENGRLYLLQSRDITTIGAASRTASYALWDNSNIVESYGGVTTPLTFSVARAAYQEAYRHLGRALGVRERDIARNARAYEQMIGLIQGRVYYNLLNWYRLLMLTPGFRFNRRFMEQMMGVTEGLPAAAVPRPADDRPFARLRAALGMSRVAGRLVSRLAVHKRAVRLFHRRLDAVLAPVDLDSMSLDELLDYYEWLQSQAIPAWDTPLVNDLYCMIFHGALRHLCAAWLGDELADVHNDLVAGEAGIISLEPVRHMKEMATIAAERPDLVAALCDGPMGEIEAQLDGDTRFADRYGAYLERFGDRCLDELKLESQTLKDDPLPLLRAVGQLARSGVSRRGDDGRRIRAEEEVAVALEGHALRRRVFALVLRLARARIRDRENLRFERTRVYGRVRSVFVNIATRLQALGVIDEIDDIFYLDVAEVTGFVRGTGVSSGLASTAAARRAEFRAYSRSENPPRRFVTNGPAQWPASFQELAATAQEDSVDRRIGQACSQGVVRGPVRIVRDPRNTEFRQGEILVAERTDPGWVTIFPLVTGMIMERGSLLSHSAIVARELGIPAVVGVANACEWLTDGDWVELDGAAGTIRRLDRTDRAA